LDEDDGEVAEVDSTRRRWLETVATACERAISDLGRDPHHHARLVADIEELLARTRAELDR
jgi:hypothetical protein